MRFHTSNIQKPVVTLTSRTHHQATLSPPVTQSRAPLNPPAARPRSGFPTARPPGRAARLRRRPRLSVTGAAPRPRPRPTPTTRTHYQRSAGMIPKTNK